MYVVYGFEFDGRKFRFVFPSFVQAVKAYWSVCRETAFISRDNEHGIDHLTCHFVPWK